MNSRTCTDEGAINNQDMKTEYTWKRYTCTDGEGQKWMYYYDKRLRLWTAYRITEAFDQIGDAEYDPQKGQLLDDIQSGRVTKPRP